MKKIARLKRKSKNPLKKAKDEADRALQDYFRKKYPEALCESCGKQFFCMHHHIPKSRSNAGRYAHINLIFICKKCHDEISFNGGSQVIARYSAKRGKKWIEAMDKLAKIKHPPFSLQELKAIKEKYEAKINKL